MKSTRPPGHEATSSNRRTPMIDQRAGLILLAAVTAAAITTALCLADDQSWPRALLVASGAASGTICVLALLLKPTTQD
ncbi:hypothetical protein Q8791_27250 [Nocardiopsis sp. CT-R113]|uniref:Uncharacterized protein n=1 Tax=Nocardiopsis codii TaxID=3065942 RepID=A0ABU7KFC4_9ACTN|nr:hypothetical protein [Nocardiopsis sp. CT-R113]MEE2040923.1 hypothetical protein [Nocardiopsis sp. CT-R113]